MVKYNQYDYPLGYAMILLIRKDYGPHRMTCSNSLLLTRVHISIVSVHLRSREGLQLAGSPLIAWTVIASAAVIGKVSPENLYCMQWLMSLQVCS